MEMAWILIFHVPHNIHNVIAQRTDKQIKQEKMLPTRKLNSQSWLPDFFNDFFENGALDKSGSSVPAINVIEEERGYKLEKKRKRDTISAKSFPTQNSIRLSYCLRTPTKKKLKPG